MDGMGKIINGSLGLLWAGEHERKNIDQWDMINDMATAAMTLIMNRSID
jgi:hypothetical protein